MKTSIDCDEAARLIDEEVDAPLRTVDAAVLQGHLESCATCAADLAALRGLMDDVAKLPESIAPGRDLWHGIAERITVTPQARMQRWHLLAAAAVLVVASSATTAWLLRHAEPVVDVATVASPTPDPELVRAYQATDTQYLQATAVLAAALRDPQNGLSPATVAAVQQNLQVIDGALAEIRTALQKDPGNPALARMLAGTHQKKVDALQRALRLSRI